MKVLKVNLGIDAAKDNCECNLSKLTDELVVKVIAAKVFLNTEYGLGESVKWLMSNRYSWPTISVGALLNMGVEPAQAVVFVFVKLVPVTPLAPLQLLQTNKLASVYTSFGFRPVISNSCQS